MLFFSFLGLSGLSFSTSLSTDGYRKGLLIFLTVTEFRFYLSTSVITLAFVFMSFVVWMLFSNMERKSLTDLGFGASIEQIV